MVKKWAYGDAWEKYPIQEGETWSDVWGSMLCADLIDDQSLCKEWMIKLRGRVNMIYVDPPWGLSALNSFMTKAGKAHSVLDYNQWSDRFVKYFTLIKDIPIFCEIGRREYRRLVSKMERVGLTVVKTWPIVYHKKNPCFLVYAWYGSNGEVRAVPSGCDPTGMDDEDTPEYMLQSFRGVQDISAVLDMAMGRGTVAVAAVRSGCLAYGIEMNKRRLAVTIERCYKEVHANT